VRADAPPEAQPPPLPPGPSLRSEPFGRLRSSRRRTGLPPRGAGRACTTSPNRRQENARGGQSPDDESPDRGPRRTRPPTRRRAAVTSRCGASCRLYPFSTETDSAPEELLGSRHGPDAAPDERGSIDAGIPGGAWSLRYVVSGNASALPAPGDPQGLGRQHGGVEPGDPVQQGVLAPGEGGLRVRGDAGHIAVRTGPQRGMARRRDRREGRDGMVGADPGIEDLEERRRVGRCEGPPEDCLVEPVDAHGDRTGSGIMILRLLRRQGARGRSQSERRRREGAQRERAIIERLIFVVLTSILSPASQFGGRQT
jgi:hypothetical protein